MAARKLNIQMSAQRKQDKRLSFMLGTDLNMRAKVNRVTVMASENRQIAIPQKV